MRNIITLFCIALFLVSCNSVKRNQKMVSNGSYEQAMELAIKKLQKDKDSKKGAEHIRLLEDAFAKAVSRDTRRIALLKKENAPQNFRTIYTLYRGLEYRQNLLRPILPLYSNSLGRNANLEIVDYSDAILESKDGFTEALYDEATRLIARNNVIDARDAHRTLTELKGLNSNYRDVNTLLDEARYMGTDFVYVTLQNRTGQIIPFRLESDLLDFSTYQLDDFWTEYHSERQQDITYNFGINYTFLDIAVAPERISEKEYIRKKKINTGWEYKLDRQGNVMKDSLGNDIKVDVFENVRARVTYTTQSKAVLVSGDVIYRDLQSRRDIDSHPLSSEFIFENLFAKFRGDKRALNKEDKDLIKFDYIPFPSDEQMVYDAGEDIKARLTEILQRNSFR